MNRDEGHAMSPKYDSRAPMGLASIDTAAYVTWPDSRAGRPAVPVDDVYLATVIHQPETIADDDGVKASSVVLGGAIGLVAAGLIVFGVSLVTRGRRSTSPSGGGR